MTIRSRLFSADEESGKRDDDRKPAKPAQGWFPRKAPIIIRRRRVIGFLFATLLIWLFIHNVPNIGPYEQRISRNYARRVPQDLDVEARGLVQDPRDPRLQEPPAPPPPSPASPEKNVEKPRRDYEGQIRFYYLASSLHSIARTMGHRDANRNVLFAASDLKAASDIIPLACEMARWKRNFVHVAIMGRDELSLEDIKRINGADKKTCDVYWHDARPDFADESSDNRMEVSVAGALGHIENFMHPQAIFTPAADTEDVFFSNAISRKSRDLHRTHIELPKRSTEILSWFTRLEASSLRVWHTATVDIVIQAPQDSSGSLVRLLKSLARADYSGFIPPRLIVELPSKFNQNTMGFLDSFTWPPPRYSSRENNNELVLRRRIPEKRISPEESSIRFLESFYPTHTQHSHALILSAQAELSPVYYQYLKYQLLEYKYSSLNASHLFGLSLESPSVHLNGSANFEAPRPHGKRNSKKSDGDEYDNDEAVSPFLWQAPNSNAALYFADKWIEIHSFLTQHNAATKHPLTKIHHRNRQKYVAEKQPAWVEYLLDLMRSRGYTMLYPGLDSSSSAPSTSDSSPLATGESLAVIHNELFQPPEEYYQSSMFKETYNDALPASSSVLETASDYLSSHHKSAEDDTLNIETPLLRNMARFLPSFSPLSKLNSEDSADAEDPDVRTHDAPPPLPHFRALPVMDYRGESVTVDDLNERAEKVAIGFRHAAGGCSEDRSRDNGEIYEGSADDLFCLDDDDLELQVDDHDIVRPNAPSSRNAASGADEAETERTPRDDTRPGKSSESSGHGSKPVYTDSAEVEDDERPTSTKGRHLHGMDGAATAINAAKDYDDYQETARAGFQNRMDQGREYENPGLDVKEHALSPKERAELSKAKRLGDERLEGVEDVVVGDVTPSQRVGDRAVGPTKDETEPRLEEDGYEDIGSSTGGTRARAPDSRAASPQKMVNAKDLDDDDRRGTRVDKVIERDTTHGKARAGAKTDPDAGPADIRRADEEGIAGNKVSRSRAKDRTVEDRPAAKRVIGWDEEETDKTVQDEGQEAAAAAQQERRPVVDKGSREEAIMRSGPDRSSEREQERVGKRKPEAERDEEKKGS